jgi:serine protein kinase
LLSDEDLSAIIPCELRESPLTLIPLDIRKQALGIAYDEVSYRHKRSGPPHRDQRIFDALLNANHGDLRKVLRHIRVERFTLSLNYKRSLVTVEPQMHVDASVQQLTLNKSYSSLPSSLQGINLYTVQGDLADANRGMIDYSDLLKRPLDTYKYLLSACETGTVNLGPMILDLDLVFIGSSNELQLDGFKEYPDFGSFKGRLELVKVPYLLRASDEQKIYEPIVTEIAGKKPVSPHVAWVLSTWAVLTRLKKPLIDRIRPFEKLRLLDTGELPNHYNQDERYIIRPYIQKIIHEYRQVPNYEGRLGASAREVKSILSEAANNREFKTLSPLAVIQEIKSFVTRTSEYDFLRQEAVDGYHDANGLIDSLIEEYTEIIDREVRESLGIYDVDPWADFMKKYITHVSTLLKKEKIKNPITGRTEDPDVNLIQEFETIVSAPNQTTESIEAYRKNLISQIGAWVLDHPKSGVDYFQIFPDLKQRLAKHFFENQKSLISKMTSALQVYGTELEDKNSEGNQLAKKTLDNMMKKLGYSEDGAKEVVVFLLKKRYQ